MDIRLIERFNVRPTDISKEALGVLEYYDKIETILEETYAAMGATSTIEVSSSLASNNNIIDVKSFGTISKTEVISRLA